MSSTEVQLAGLLRSLIDADYEAERHDRVEDWEARLEGLLEHEETQAEGLDETGDDDQIRQHHVSDIHEHDACSLSPEQEVVDLWHRWNGIGEINVLHAEELRADEPSFAGLVRRTVHYWIHPDVTDEFIEEAARDAAGAYARRHAAFKTKHAERRK